MATIDTRGHDWARAMLYGVARAQSGDTIICEPWQEKDVRYLLAHVVHHPHVAIQVKALDRRHTTTKEEADALWQSIQRPR